MRSPIKSSWGQGSCWGSRDQRHLHPPPRRPSRGGWGLPQGRGWAASPGWAAPLAGQVLSWREQPAGTYRAISLVSTCFSGFYSHLISPPAGLSLGFFFLPNFNIVVTLTATTALLRP